MDVDKYPGPYRATKLWNEAICLFRNGMPLKRHRKHIKLYDSCFTGAEAVSWLHSTLMANPNFGPDVTKEKTHQLLSKFYKVGVFQSASNGSSDNLEAFKENELYRFVCRSPLRNIQLSSLASLTSQNPPLNKGVSRSTSKCALSQRFPKRSPSFQSHYLEEIKSRAASNQLKQMEVEEVWKTVVLGRLQALLGSLNVDEMLPSNQTSGARIMKNACMTNGLAPYQSFNRSQLFPRWILAAMKSLIDWPHLSRGASCSIWYPGFEVDVFKVIKDYFINLESPLISSFLYSAFINSYAYVQYVESLQEFDECASTYADFPDKSCLPSKSQENLVLNMSVSGPKDCWNQSQSQCYPSKARETLSALNESSSDNCGASRRGSWNRTPVVKNFSSPGCSNENDTSHCWGESQFYSATKLLSSTLPPNACFETAFTSDSPVTRIIPRKLVESIHVTHKNRQKESLSQKSFYHDPHLLKEPTSSHHSDAPDVLCNIRRNSSAPNLLDIISSTNNGTLNDGASKAERKGNGGNTHLNECVAFVKMQPADASYPNLGNFSSNPSNNTCTRNKVKRTKSYMHDGSQQRSVNRRKYPSESGLNEKLHHIRNKSGGYVNIALSNSVDDINQSYSFDCLLREDLDYDKALETLHRLIKCTYRDGESESFLEGKRSDACGNQSCSSTSSLWSYHTAASGEQSCSSTTPAATPRIVLDYSSRNSTAEELMNTGINTVQGVQLGLDIFQLLLLLLPPVNRYKLHLLLYFMSNIIGNGGLVLQDGVCAKSLLLDTFTQSVLRPVANSKGDEGLARRMVSFFVDNHQALFQVSASLQAEVNAHLVQLPNQAELSGSSGMPMAYCERISCEQFEEQKLVGSRLALAELLDQIVMDEKMGSKEKKKRLKMFREAYPHIYYLRFPNSKKENEKLSKPKRLLGFASLSRLKNMRI